jgi:hypothetical protein
LVAAGLIRQPEMRENPPRNLTTQETRFKDILKITYNVCINVGVNKNILLFVSG